MENRIKKMTIDEENQRKKKIEKERRETNK